MASQSNKKPKLVRDSFTIPKAEFAAIETLKTRAIALGTSVKKSELLRAGLMALQGLNDAAYKAALSAVPTLKTGRPTGADKKPEAAKNPASKPAVKVAVKTAVKVAPKAPAKPLANPASKTAAPAAAKKVAAKPAVKKAAPAKKAVAA
ncbi:hypothetical protein [Hydrogenophaga sp. PBL-H3]|uniref:hypothetical protein n=1 Tax=Hydrogenophaga sp. PBL-H3 TaxID=434010 RepID=UPI00135C2E45|nr:hypothetical protein [Hydrogenophaga sp. PBL-H3]